MTSKLGDSIGLKDAVRRLVTEVCHRAEIVTGTRSVRKVERSLRSLWDDYTAFEKALESGDAKAERLALKRLTSRVARIMRSATSSLEG